MVWDVTRRGAWNVVKKARVWAVPAAAAAVAAAVAVGWLRG